ncbi:MAG: hypothetical protein ABI851_13745 [Saprospiraceae bacterium]
MNPEARYGAFLHVLAVALVLALPGITLLGLLQTLDLEKQWKDQVPMVLELKQVYAKDSLELLKVYLKGVDEIDQNSIEFLSREKAFNEMKDDPSLGLQDSMIENPFLDILIFYPRKGADLISMKTTLQKGLSNFQCIESIDAGEKLENGFRHSASKIKAILIGLSLFFSVLAFFIIGYLIKIYMSRKQDLIKSIHLMGGDFDKAYKPYLSIGIRQGLASAFLSIVLIGLGLLSLFLLVPGIYNLISLKNFSIIILVLCILGPTLHIIGLRKIIKSLFQS